MKGHKIFPLLTILLFAILVGIAVFKLFYQVRTGADLLITQEVKQLVEIFKKIDKDCKILSFDYQKNPINFLNIEKFHGSEVAPMNLVHPEKWKGPYLYDNPTIQGKDYQIVQTKKGYFITPGDGVRLSNGKVVGKDLVLDKKSDIMSMMQDEQALMFEGKALAAPLPVGTSDLQKVMMKNIVRADDDLVFLEGGTIFHLGNC